MNETSVSLKKYQWEGQLDPISDLSVIAVPQKWSKIVCICLSLSLTSGIRSSWW